MVSSDSDADGASVAGLRENPEWPHPSRLSPDHPEYPEILLRHTQAMACGQPGYLDPATGLLVLTARTHMSRGACCQNGCRHCPYLPL